MIGPILRALGHRPAAAVLIVLEVGFGFAVSVQAFVLGRWFDRVITDPTGQSEDVFAVWSESAEPDPGDPAVARARDVAVLESVPNVVAVGAVRRVPLNRSLFPRVVYAGGRLTAVWPVDGARTRQVLDVPLLEGRDLTPEDASQVPLPVLIDEDLGATLFPGQRALGQTFNVRGRPQPLIVVGVTGRLRAISAFAPHAHNVLVFPDEPPARRGQAYIVRAAPRTLGPAMAEAQKRLLAAAPARALQISSLRSLGASLDQSGRGGVAIFNFMVVLVILVVLSGTFGMLTFLVAERTRQIGMRRALGATRRDVVRYFLLENWLLTSLGLIAGLPLAYGLNVLARLAQPDLYLEWPPLALGVVLFWVTGELAALLPALRAANVPPTVATRTV